MRAAGVAGFPNESMTGSSLRPSEHFAQTHWVAFEPHSKLQSALWPSMNLRFNRRLAIPELPE